MQGYILRVQKVKNEDLLVFILTNDKFLKAYRFYGARHSIVTQGYKIDFELEQDGIFLPKLRSPMHLGFSWLLDRDKVLVWQYFMKLLYEHLKDSNELESFYFDLLDLATQKLKKQNPKRVVIETYLEILAYEGRLHDDLNCFICDENILHEVCLCNGFSPAHKNCVYKKSFKASLIKNMFKTKNTIELNDDEINELYLILSEGI